jgi:hypothetical protein
MTLRRMTAVLLLACAAGQVNAETPAKPAVTTGTAVFPAAVDHKYASETPGRARMHTCLAQYHANKAAKANGNLKWIQAGGGYYSVCLKKLKS